MVNLFDQRQLNHHTAVQGGVLQPDVGFVAAGAPADAGFSAALDDELQRLATFLGIG